MATASFAKRVSARKGFLGCVYSTLAVQLLITFMVIYGFRKHPVPQQDSERWCYIYAALMLCLVMLLAITSNRHWIGMFVFVLLSLAVGGMFHIALSRVARKHIDTALICTVSIFVAMTILGFLLAFFDIDLSWMAAYLFAALVGLLVVSVLSMFVKNDVYTKVITMAGVVLFSMYVVHTTNVLTQPSYKRNCLDSAVQLYLDFLNLFARSVRR